MVTSVNGAPQAAVDHSLADRLSATRSDVDQAPRSLADQAVIYSGPAEAPGQNAIAAVQDNLNVAAAISDRGLGAGSIISGLLDDARDKVVAAQNAEGPQTQAQLNADYQDILADIDATAGSASYQGKNLFAGGANDELQIKVDVRGESSIGLKARDFTSRGLNLAGTDLLGSSGDLQIVLQKVDSARGALGVQVQEIAAQSQQIQAHAAVLNQLQDGLAGAGGDNLNAEGARLQALQVQQSLIQQGSGISQGVQGLLALLRY